MKPCFRHCLFFLPLMFCHSATNAVELVQWQRLPLSVALHTGHERIIFINKNVRVGYPAELDGKLRIQSSGGTVYLRAAEDFPDTRLQLFDMDNGELILLDVRATAGDELEPLELRYDNAVWRNDTVMTEETKNRAQTVAPEEYAGPLPVMLTRYAAQMLFSPLRTVEPLPDIAPVPVRLPPEVTTLLPTEPVTATPLAAWRLGDTTVTAIKLQNRAQPPVHLDPRALQGHFLTATFQHSWLGAHGTPEDTTVVYLVTDGSADSAILPEPVPEKTKKKEDK
ncbi:TIGR03749 family integrating conjugative element protein [Klebsiella pneumoniae]|uniref:TIGR03749 family integrating conjugative element protein n=1 Tax=Klebsiella pneumoniae TaxID=573 RepID=UPI00203E9DDF|nr:TIGR03749 family integrating conjugative element protein [Klebsiella pneumoniae]USB67186.1 TIGR03749 family integrating conjugative element protein [Klebsiella pneumoniae]